MVSTRKTLEPTQAILDRANGLLKGILNHVFSCLSAISLSYRLQAEFPVKAGTTSYSSPLRFQRRENRWNLVLKLPIYWVWRQRLYWFRPQQGFSLVNSTEDHYDDGPNSRENDLKFSRFSSESRYHFSWKTAARLRAKPIHVVDNNYKSNINLRNH